MPEEKAPKTHVAVPVDVFQAVVNILATLPYQQVAGVMKGLDGLPTASIQPGEAEGEIPSEE
jgi:hypothetical protein